MVISEIFRTPVDSHTTQDGREEETGRRGMGEWEDEGIGD